MRVNSSSSMTRINGLSDLPSLGSDRSIFVFGHGRMHCRILLPKLLESQSYPPYLLP